ncbi:MAG TPA: helix-turn-helix transcriptional regulator [Pyrinomonadaceae bacterium]|jgi:transcriptional regulator with XRE-family HTH domain|nr:helix-turn-helix transcriptional regulator [Pyrinomonadaceae bacterium]
MGRARRPKPARLAMKLLRIREALGVSQAEMVKRLDYPRIHPAHVSGYERGEREPPLPVLLRYARLARISTDVLIDDEMDLPAKLTRKI